MYIIVGLSKRAEHPIDSFGVEPGKANMKCKNLRSVTEMYKRLDWMHVLVPGLTLE